MNDYSQIAKLANNKPQSEPNDSEITQTIQLIEDRLKIKAINRYKNLGVKEGYVKAVEMLKAKVLDHEKANVSQLKTTQGRAIAFLAIDYLKGECFQDVLCGVPIKEY